ncbi:glycosyltransferase [Bizionia myxarmorum]|uniref:Glycosyltransferase family 4 protein n=1 Tax=Bizionia myxarmorum TaxID=291186 RepID=A0A5D0RF42_9FLAO|nr:glycosyltransferase [Bizionia myxarmorum]TYB79571.1 glycosyltransferase family 4 protein [Bizionia myxarmorum]
MRKKILIIPSWYPNTDNELIGTFFKEQAQLLNENGFDIKIIYGIEKELGLFDYLKSRLKHAFSKNKLVNRSYLIQDPEACSFSINHYKKWPTKWKLQNSKKAYQKAFEIITNSWCPELIHAQCTANGGIYAHYLSKINKLPFVIIEHQTFLLNYYHKKTQRAIREAIENASKIGAVSYHQQRCILMNSMDCNPEIIWNLMDEQKFQIPVKTEKSKFTILAITYPQLIKDSETFFRSLEAFKELYNGDFEAIIIGNDSFLDGSKANSSYLESLAKKHNVLDNCTFYPKLTRTEINVKLQSCDVFVSTSVAETYGVAVREAMLCGKPVIATKSGGVEDSITAETGVLVNLKDAEAIAENLLKIKNKELVFNPEAIRSLVIKQSGRAAFIKTMTDFYT